MDEQTRMIMDKLPLVWGAPKKLKTSRGVRVLRVAPIAQDSPFWKIWKSHKEAIKGVAISVGKDKQTGAWQACHWGLPEDDVAPADIVPEKKPETTTDRIRKSGINIHPSGKKNPDPVLPAKGGLKYLPFQEEGIQFHRNRHRSMIADEMGLGKTVQALGIINDSRQQTLQARYDRVLVLCPASLKTNWKQEAEKWIEGTPMTYVVEGGSMPTPFLGKVIGGDSCQIVICNYEVLHNYAAKFKDVFDLIILDEAQYIKSRDAKRTAAARMLWKNSPHQHVLFLTGTPIMNRPEEIFPIYDACAGSNKKTWTAFSDRYCDPYTDRFGRHTHGASNLGELHGVLREFTIRRLKKDVLPQLPDKRRQFIELNSQSAVMTKVMEKSTKAGQALERKMKQLRKSNGGVAEIKEADLTLKELTKLRREQGMLKVPIAVKHIRTVMDQLDPDGKVIIFAHHTKVIERLMEELKLFQPVCIKGTTTTEARQFAVGRFQTNPKCRVFIGNIQAAGTGLTLTASSTVIFVESDWSPSMNLQCEDRAHRITQKEKVLVQYLNVKGSLDIKIARSCMKKMEILNTAVDGAKGASPNV